jgi:hypothetical protein
MNEKSDAVRHRSVGGKPAAGAAEDPSAIHERTIAVHKASRAIWLWSVVGSGVVSAVTLWFVKRFDLLSLPPLGSWIWGSAFMLLWLSLAFLSRGLLMYRFQWSNPEWKGMYENGVALSVSGDPHSLGSLIEIVDSFPDNFGKECEALVFGLERLLLKWSKTGSPELSEDHVSALYRILRYHTRFMVESTSSSYAPKGTSWSEYNVPLATAILTAYRHVGGGREIQYVSKLADDVFRNSEAFAVMEAANACLPHLSARAAEEKEHDTLLRPAYGDQETLLRPVGGPNQSDEQTLLRPVLDTDKNGENHLEMEGADSPPENSTSTRE